MKRTIALALALVMLLALLCGCSGGKDKYAAAGEYLCTSMTVGAPGEEPFTADPSMMGMEIVLTLIDDGTGSISYAGGETVRQLLWSQDGEELTLTIEGDSTQASCKDDKVSIYIVDDAGEVEYVFTKR